MHPEAEYRIETATLVFKEERETFLVARGLWPELPGELTPMVLFLAINRQKVPFLWGIRLPGEDGRHDEWNASALEAAELAQRDWVRVVANMSLGAYEVFSASGNIPEPEWPTQSFQEILKIAFKGRFIDQLDHPAICAANPNLTIMERRQLISPPASPAPHPYAELVREMTEEEYLALRDDIQRQGQLEPVIFYQDHILDGRHRYRACRDLGISPVCEELLGTEAEAGAFVISQNTHRRHLTASERKKLVASALVSDPSQSDRQIAPVQSVSPRIPSRHTVERWNQLRKLRNCRPERGGMASRVCCRQLSQRPRLKPILRLQTPMPRSSRSESCCWPCVRRHALWGQGRVSAA